jgi:hypothetical protein
MASGTTSVRATNWLASSVALTAVLFFVSEKHATIVNVQMTMAACK